MHKKISRVRRFKLWNITEFIYTLWIDSTSWRWSNVQFCRLINGISWGLNNGHATVITQVFGLKAS